MLRWRIRQRRWSASHREDSASMSCVCISRESFLRENLRLAVGAMTSRTRSALMAALMVAWVGAHGATVHWLDPLAYEKPAAVDLAMPDEAKATKYYVDFAGGADTPVCGASPAHPCASMRGLADRNLPGLAGNAK